MTVYGWDLSNHDWDRRVVNLAEARKAGIALVTHKATEGNWYRDPYFDDFARQLDRVSFPVVGSYHVLNHNIDVNAQTDFWTAQVAAVAPNWHRHPCVIWQIDAEPLDGYKAPTKAEIVACGKRLEARGIKRDQIVVYAPRWVYGDTLAGLPYRLWASNYVGGSGGFRSLYPGDGAGHWGAYSGQTPLIVQYSSSAVIGGQHTCDANAVRVPSEAALQALFIPPAPKPKPTPAPAGKPTPAPAPLPGSPLEGDMRIAVVDPAECRKKNVTWPGWFTTDGYTLTHIATVARRDALLRLGYPSKKISLADYYALGGH